MRMRKLGFQKTLRHKVGGAKMPKAMKAPKAMGADLLEGQTTVAMKKGGSVKGFSTKGGRGGVAKRGLGKAVKGFEEGGAVDVAPDRQTPLPGPDGRIRRRVGTGPTYLRGNNNRPPRGPINTERNPIWSPQAGSSPINNPQVTGMKPPRLRPAPGGRGDVLVPTKPIRAYKKGGAVNKNTWGSTEDITGRGPSPAAAKADYAKKMKAAGLNPKTAKSVKNKDRKFAWEKETGLAKGGMAKKPRGGVGIMIILGKKGK